MLRSTASLILLLASSAAAAALPNASSTPIYPEVLLNGNTQNGIYPINQIGKKLCVSAAVEKALGFTHPAAACLEDIPGVSVHYNAAEQKLDITVPAKYLDLPPTVLSGIASAAAGAAHPSIAPGLAVGYDLYASVPVSGHATTQGNWSLETEPTLGTRWGVLSSQFLSNNSRTTRLSTTFTHYIPSKDMDVSFGDVLSGSTNWSRSVRLGGVQIRSDFAESPDLITFPLPSFYGQAALPSTVELFVNAEKMYEGKVPGGAFSLQNAPTISGAGTAYFSVQNALGIVQTASVPFYTSPQLLRPGLWSFDLSAGFPNYGFGRNSFDYGSNPALSATAARGITDHLTLQGHLEASHGLRLGGIGVIYQPGLYGTLHAAYATSGSGSLADLGYAYAGRTWSLSWDSQRTFGDYKDIASIGEFGRPPPRRQDQLNLGYNSPVGQFSLGYVGLQYRGQPASRFATLGFDRSLFGGYLSLTASRDLGSHSNLFTLSYTHAFGSGGSAGVSYDSERQATMRIQDSQRPWGYLANFNASPGFRYGQIEADYRGQHFWAAAGVQGTPNDPYGYAQLQGTIVLHDHDVLTGPPLFGSPYAIVSTGTGGIPVSYENRPVGKTDAHGNLLVSELVPWIGNKFSLPDVMNLPADLDVGQTEQEVVPEPGAGVAVDFAVSKSSSATITLTHDGKPVPTGSTITLDGNSSEVGFGGQAYLRNLKPHNAAVVSLVGGATCSASFDWKAGERAVSAVCK